MTSSTSAKPVKTKILPWKSLTSSFVPAGPLGASLIYLIFIVTSYFLGVDTNSEGRALLIPTHKKPQHMVEVLGSLKIDVV